MLHSYWLYMLIALVALPLLQVVQQPSSSESSYSANKMGVDIGGQPAVALRQPQPADKNRPAIVAAEIVPGMGMNIYQLRAWVPGKGLIDMLEAPPIETATHSARVGGGILLPWANRVRGKLSADGKTLETQSLGRTITLEANRAGRQPGAERHAIHGLFLARSMDRVTLDSAAGSAAVTGSWDAGNFEGHWPSKALITVRAYLKDGAFGFDVTAKNTGNEPMPFGAGWHPFFLFPSGERAQVRLHIPATQRALVNNYDDVFPTGQVVPVKGTPYDFTAPGGVPLKDLFLDDCFLGLQRTRQGEAVAEMIDEAANYGVRVRARSPQTRAMQVFAPVGRKVVAIEPQFNLADPFGKIWGDVNTGMVTLKPGESVTYSVQVEVFLPR